MQLIPMPSALLSCLLLFPLRGQEPCQKQVGIPDRGRRKQNMPSLRTIIFILAIVAFQGSSVFADSLSKQPFCIYTDNGWTLGISYDGSATLFRTGKPRLRVSAAAGAFNYGKITDATAIASRRYPTSPTRLKYFYGQFDKPEVHPLPESTIVCGLLNRAQEIFEDCQNQKIIDLLRKHPIRIE